PTIPLRSSKVLTSPLPRKTWHSGTLGTFTELLDKAVYNGGQLRAILFGSLRRLKSAISKGLCERRTLGAHALNCPPLERPREKVPQTTVSKRHTPPMSLAGGL